MIGVIGAGPVGSYYASLCKEDCVVFEEHKKIGEPVQCTGIMTSEILKFIPKEVIVNKLSILKLVSPSGFAKEIRLKKDNIVVDRAKVDKYFADKVDDLRLRWKFIGFDGKEARFSNGKKVKVDKLVAADGAGSEVAKGCGLWQDRKFVSGMQARVKGKFDANVFQVNLGICKGGFGWVVPESDNVARVGVVGYNDVNGVFKKFVHGNVIEYSGGLIPLYKKIRLVRDNVALVGDAGLMVKAFSYGGVIQGLKGAQELAKGFDGYESRVNKRICGELRGSLRTRKFADRLSRKEYDYLINNLKGLDGFERDSRVNIDFLFRNWRLWFFALKKRFI